LLISLLNSILAPEDQVADITLLNPYNGKNFQNDKLSILDIKAKGSDGKMFNIEIQITDEADYDKRALYYWARIFTEQLQTNKNDKKLGRNYSHLNKAIHVLKVMNFNAEEREIYDSHLKWLMLEASALNKRFDDGRSEGRAEGRLEAITVVAKQMISIGIPLDQICKVTGFDITELTELIKQQLDAKAQRFAKS